jgi:hypothetical protein
MNRVVNLIQGENSTMCERPSITRTKKTESFPGVMM